MEPTYRQPPWLTGSYHPRPDDATLWLAKATAYEGLRMYENAFDAAAEGLRETHHAGAVERKARDEIAEFLRKPIIAAASLSDTSGELHAQKMVAARTLQRTFRRMRGERFARRVRHENCTGLAQLVGNLRALIGIFSQSVGPKSRNLGQPCTIFVSVA